MRRKKQNEIRPHSLSGKHLVFASEQPNHVRSPRSPSGALVCSLLMCLLLVFLTFETKESLLANDAVTHRPALGSRPALAHVAEKPHLAGLPLAFEMNQGQADPSVRFVTRGAGYSVALTASEAVVTLREENSADPFLRSLDARSLKRFQVRKFYRSAPRFHRSVKNRTVRVALVGANPNPNIEALDELPGKSNYFIGSDPTKWQRGISNFARVKYVGIYPGVDLAYYGKNGQLEFDFIVSPSGDPSSIALDLPGNDQKRIVKGGAIAIGTLPDEILMHRPTVYQVLSGHKRFVPARFDLRADGKVGITVGAYDTSRQLIIDPVLSYSTYLGGSGIDQANAIAVDPSGNAYVAGQTTSTDFPTNNGYPSSSNAEGIAFISKLDPTGTTLLYSTYLGGTGGESANGIALDTNANVYVTGYTYSTDFPIVNGLQTLLANPNGNGFVARIDTTQSGSASLVYSSYLGGGGNASNSAGDFGTAIAADSRGLMYVTGQTASDGSVTPFPTSANAYQTSLASPNGNAFLAVLNTNQTGSASLAYGTYLGGDGAGPLGDYGASVAVDALGDAFIVGQTSSDASGPFPTTTTAYQTSLNSSNGNAFITEIPTSSNAPTLAYSTYFGGSSSSPIGDSGNGIALDTSGKVYITGDTTSSDFPVTAGAFQSTNSTEGKAFASKWDVTQTGNAALTYSTFLGGTDGSIGDVGNGVALDPSGNAVVVGGVSSTDFPTTADAVQATLNSSAFDGFVTSVNSSGTGILYSSYLGGSCATGDSAMSVALDAQANPYVTGYTCSADFPITPSGAYQATLAGTQSGFVTKFSLSTSIAAVSVSPQNPSLLPNSTQEFSATATLSNGGTQDVTANVVWNSSNTALLTISNLVRAQGFASSGATPGTGTVTATLGSLSGSTSVTVVAPPAAPNINTVSPTSGSASTQVTVTGTGFGVQSSGVIYLGSALGNVSSWTDTQIIATVAPGSASGSVQVVQSGQDSNLVSFTVNGPTITGISPTNGVATTSVTITGSGFGSSEGSGQVWLGTAYGLVTGWGDSQIVATVASGSSSGKVQVLQSGTWSNSIPFTINTPQITAVSPTSGANPTLVTVTGSGFGASQGSGQVWIGSTSGIVQNWSDSQVTAIVATAAVTGIVRIEQGGVWSNSFPFTVPVSGGSQLTLVPNVLTMTAGSSHSVQALNAQGQSVSGLTWASSDSTVVSLSTDDPPLLTAVAAGHATISAGMASLDATVIAGSSLPSGTVSWTNPGDGSGVTSVVPAVPSLSGVDVFAFQSSGNVAAISSDGTTAWTANIAGAEAIPDFNGGLVVNTTSGSSATVKELDPMTGQAHPGYTSATIYTGIAPLVHTDGTIFLVDNGAIVGIDPSTGAGKFTIPLPQTVSSGNGNCGEQQRYETSGPTVPSQGLIAGDGYAYFTYSYTLVPLASNDKTCYPSGGGITETQFSHIESHSRILRVGTDGSSTTIDVGDSTQDSSYICYWTEFIMQYGECSGDEEMASGSSKSGLPLGPLITNADQGVMMSSNDCSTNPACVGQLTVYNNGVLTSSVATAIPLYPVLQRTDGSYVGYSGNNMVAFGVSGAVSWTVPNYEPQILTIDGGVIAQSIDGSTTAMFDSSGNATGQPGAGSASLQTSWLGASFYSVDSGLSLKATAATPPSYAPSYAGVLSGSPSANGTAIALALYPVTPTPPLAKQLPAAGATLNVNRNAIEIITTASPDTIFTNYLASYDGAGRATPNPNDVAEIVDWPPPPITGTGQNVTFKLLNVGDTEGCAPISDPPCAKPLQDPFTVQTERFDTSARVISVVTMAGHPIAGWRYWRIFSLATNDYVVETGAIDTYAGGGLPGSPFRHPLNWMGYYVVGRQDQLKIWEEDLRYILRDIQQTLDSSAVQGTTLRRDLVKGVWSPDPDAPTQTAVFEVVCQAPTCN
jgi:hypothetical protein